MNRYRIPCDLVANLGMLHAYQAGVHGMVPAGNTTTAEKEGRFSAGFDGLGQNATVTTPCTSQNKDILMAKEKSAKAMMERKQPSNNL
ncbi:hypothetical protein VE02_08449 [Pseudogymnoascus sp. 03VT05]|nr:hypothetical protein VE02_08449 [Pseudogymnoascus sp. 03VT05]